MKEIQLTQGQVALIDDEDFEKVSRYKWYARYDKVREVFTAATNCIDRSTLRLHSLLLDCQEGYTPDHIDRNPLNNLRSNLRVANRTQQELNKFPQGSIGFKGVCFKKSHGKYLAQISKGCKPQHVGYFDSPIDAALAYDLAALEYWSQVPDDPISGNYTQFLYLNFPEG